MKRLFTTLGQDGPSSSPEPQFKLPPQTLKRPRRSNLFIQLGTPAVPHDNVDTPDSIGLLRSCNSLDWPSSTRRKFEHFNIDTPIAGVAESTKPSPSLLLLRSQSLPVDTSNSSDDQELTDDFKLFCSQTYTRSASQDLLVSSGTTPKIAPRAATPHGRQPPPKQEVGFAATGFPLALGGSLRHTPLPASGSLHAALAPPPAADTHAATPLLSSVTPIASQEDGAHGSDDGGQNEVTHPPAVTPEMMAPTPCDKLLLGSARGGGGGGGTPLGATPQDDGPKLFPIFRPKSQRKFLCIVRHGESEFNRACHEAASFEDPMIFDPPLTGLGRKQAQALKAKLAQVIAKHGSDVLWVVSPLTRCIQTFLESCPCADQLVALRTHDPLGLASAAGGSNSAPSTASVTAAAASAAGTGGAKSPNVVVLQTIAEYCITAGDVGRPPAYLARDFPQLAPQLTGLPDAWWYTDPRKPSCALSRVMGCCEPKDHFQRRVAEFSRWLNSRPERVIVAIGHCSFWNHFLNKKKRLKNCEMHTMYW